MPDDDSPVLPRGLIFLASLWLVGSWLVAIGVSPPVQPSSASYTPGVRLLLDCIAVGVVFAWPLLRMSQPRCRWSIQRAALDVLVITSLLQLVVWPMRLVTPWSVLRTVAIDSVLVGWTALLGAVLAVGGSLSGSGRTAAMSVCMMLAFIGPLAGLAAAELGAENATVAALGSLSPFTMLRRLTEAGPGTIVASDLGAALVGPAAAAAAWAAFGLTALRRNRSDAAHRNGDDGASASGQTARQPLSSSPHV